MVLSVLGWLAGGVTIYGTHLQVVEVDLGVREGQVVLQAPQALQPRPPLVLELPEAGGRDGGGCLVEEEAGPLGCCVLVVGVGGPMVGQVQINRRDMRHHNQTTPTFGPAPEGGMHLLDAAGAVDPRGLHARPVQGLHEAVGRPVLEVLPCLV